MTTLVYTHISNPTLELLMKKIITKSLLLLGIALQGGAMLLAGNEVCRVGFQFQISHLPAWGASQPVVTSIAPFGPADRSGLRVGDIIESIDGVPTLNLTGKQIHQLLHTRQAQHILQISNFGRQKKTYLLGRDCKLAHSVTERELAELFALYSLEDASSQRIAYPFTYQQASTFRLDQVRTFAFAPSSPATQGIDQALNTLIRKALVATGLEESHDSPDLLISTYYQLSPVEPTAKPSDEMPFGWRYDPQHRDLKPLPVLPSQSPLATYKLSLGIVAQNPQTQKAVWSCEANESLGADMSIPEYAAYSIPIMLQGFPLAPNTLAPSWTFQTLRYHYTGLVYDKATLRRVIDVEYGSPAMSAGILPGDIIKSINGIELDHPSLDDLLTAYYTFAERSEKYRDKDLPAMHVPMANLQSRYWAPRHYDAIATMLLRDRSDAAFSYLFSFRPYINPERLDVLVFEVERRGEVYRVPIRPEKRDESTIIPN